MSDEAKSNEIDEVLSSVRKLVNRAVRDDDAAGERLLLTPDDRIDEAEPQPEPEETPPANDNNVLILDPSRPVENGGLEATIAQLETALSTPVEEEEWVPEEPDHFDEAEWAISASADDGGAEPEPDPTDEEPVLPSETQDPAAELAAFFQDDMPRDREALRELIVQVLREELSADTGERITRNVRKLIRREVKQILAARDL